MSTTSDKTFQYDPNSEARISQVKYRVAQAMTPYIQHMIDDITDLVLYEQLNPSQSPTSISKALVYRSPGMMKWRDEPAKKRERPRKREREH